MNKSKLTKQFTINFDDATSNLINKLADINQRKPAEYLRLLLLPVLLDEYAKTQLIQHSENAQPIQPAIFKK